MVQFLLYLIPISITFEIINWLWLSSETSITQCKLSSLSDKLKWEAKVNKKIKTTDKGYIYLEDCLNKTALVIPKLNIWIISYLIFKNRKKPVDNNLDAIKAEIEGSNLLREVSEEYEKIITKYLFKKSMISILLFKPLLNFWLKSAADPTNGQKYFHVNKYHFKKEVEQEYFNYTPY